MLQVVKLPICVLPQSPVYFCSADRSHELSELVQDTPKYFRRIILLPRDDHPLSEGYDEVRNTSFTINTK